MTPTFDLYQRSADFLWTDRHIARQMLAFHLDPANDAASRNERTIDDTVGWIHESIPAGSSVLDLGCGPGLYAERLARLGHSVTGIDISRNSISYAKRSARKLGLDIRYRAGSYLRDLGCGAQDVAICVYCDFGALTPGEQAAFLRNVSRTLKPGGTLVFDVFTEALSAAKTPSKGWEYCESGGFWSARPHYVLHECRHFAEAKAWGTRNVIIDSRGSREFITWDTMYTEERVAAQLAEHGFAVEEIKRDLIRKNSFTSEDVLFVRARAGAR